MKLNLQNTLTHLALGAALVTTSAFAHDLNRLGPDTTVAFPEKHAQLSDEAKEKLDHLIADAKASGKIDTIKIAVWSDNPAPVADKSLSRTDRHLADAREHTLTSYLEKGLGVHSVTTYNMAERANWLARVFNTDEAKLKTQINDQDEPMSKEAFRIFKDNGQPSKAVVLVVMKNKQ